SAIASVTHDNRPIRVIPNLPGWQTALILPVTPSPWRSTMLNAVLLVLGVLSTDADSVLKRGKPVPAAPTVTIDAILANPAGFPDTQVVVIDGMVVRSCTSMGCWMQLADGP